ncbi:dienelactone hydrolase family protein [Gammaproteobacteria bacterium AH-315-E17]|nr:dienelactone hydrolase family protein [Gammaproteobacteria bacterium AH-315-E17]
MLHGRTQSPQYMFDLADRIDLPQLSYVALHADNNSWYPEKFMEAIERNQPSLDFSIDAITAVIEKLNAQGVPSTKIYFFGFSQGACLACEYVYRNSQQPWGGLIAFTGGLIGEEGTQWEISESCSSMPVILGSSDIDEWVPVKRTQETADVFSRMGAKVTLRVYPDLDHSVNDDEINLVRSLFSDM